MADGNRFIILKNIKEFTINLEPLLKTFPRKDLLSRGKIYDTSLELLELAIKANHEKDKK